MMDVDESKAEATRILSEAGWIAGDGWGSYFHGTCIGGLAPDGNVYVKNIAAIKPGHPKYGPDTPDEYHEAAVWLAERYKSAGPADAASIPVDALEYRMPSHLSADQFDPQPEDVVTYADAPSEELSDEAHGEAGEEAAAENTPRGGLGGSPDLHSGRVNEGPDGGISEGSAAISGMGAFTNEPSGSDADEPIDADFTIEDLPLIELTERDADPDFGADVLAMELDMDAAIPPSDPESASGAFIFGDNLGNDRIIRIGQLAEHALALITEAKQGYDEAEHIGLRSLVVTRLDSAGQYTGDQGTYDRFLALEAVIARVRAIESYRDDRQDYIRKATHADVAAFDPADGWP